MDRHNNDRHNIKRCGECAGVVSWTHAPDGKSGGYWFGDDHPILDDRTLADRVSTAWAHLVCHWLNRRTSKLVRF